MEKGKELKLIEKEKEPREMERKALEKHTTLEAERLQLERDGLKTIRKRRETLIPELNFLELPQKIL